MTVTKEHCKTLKVTKLYYVRIKRVRAVLTSGEIHGNTYMRGNIYLWAHGEDRRNLRSWGDCVSFSDPSYNTYNHTIYLSAKDAKARYESTDLYGKNNRAGTADPLRDVQRDFTLADIKSANGYIEINSRIYSYPGGASNEHTTHKLWFTLYDDE